MSLDIGMLFLGAFLVGAIAMGNASRANIADEIKYIREELVRERALKRLDKRAKEAQEKFPPSE